MSWYTPPRRKLLIGERKKLLDKANKIINDVKSFGVDVYDLDKSISWLKDTVAELERINKRLKEIDAELTRIPKTVPKLGLAEVRELLEDECDVWNQYFYRFPNVSTFRRLYDFCKAALEEFNRRNWSDAYYMLADAYNIMVERRKELEPIMTKVEGRKDMFEVELDYIKQLGQWVRDMRYKGERLAGLEEYKKQFRGWRR